MSDRLSDKKLDDSIAGTARGATVAGAAKAAVEQSMQAGAKASDASMTAVREQASAMPAFASKAAATARDGAVGVAQAVQANVETAGRLAGEQVTSNTNSMMEKAMTTTEELMSFGQANMEAFVKSGQIWATGLQDLTRHMAQSAQAQFDGSVSAFKAMAGVKSVHEAIELQSSMARNAMEKAVQDGGKLTDASLKLAEQTMAPITARVTYVTERFGRAAA